MTMAAESPALSDTSAKIPSHQAERAGDLVAALANALDAGGDLLPTLPTNTDEWAQLELCIYHLRQAARWAMNVERGIERAGDVSP